MSDNTEIARIQQRMQQCTKKLHDLTTNVGMARQVKEFSSDLRKQALAVEMVKSIKAGESASAADCIARASDAYASRLAAMGEQLAEAERIIAEWQATQASFEAARSLLSMQKETMRQLEG